MRIWYTRIYNCILFLVFVSFFWMMIFPPFSIVDLFNVYSRRKCKIKSIKAKRMNKWEREENVEGTKRNIHIYLFFLQFFCTIFSPDSIFTLIIIRCLYKLQSESFVLFFLVVVVGAITFCIMCYNTNGVSLGPLKSFFFTSIRLIRAFSV